MKIYSAGMLCLSILLLTAGCNQQANKEAKLSTQSDSAATGTPASFTGVENSKDNVHRFIRTAQLKFKVRDVIRSTYDIEHVVQDHAGFVTATNLASNTDEVAVIAVSADSSLETTYYTVVNEIVLRVPDTALDNTLKAIAANIGHLDYRIIKAEDVRLQLLSNSLLIDRNIKGGQRLTQDIGQHANPIGETTSAVETLLSRQERADNAKISNLTLLDQVKYSTVNLSIYQRQAIQRELISNNKNIEAYEPGFGAKLREALGNGLELLEYLTLLVSKLWGFFLLILLMFLAIKIYNKYTEHTR